MMTLPGDGCRHSISLGVMLLLCACAPVNDDDVAKTADVPAAVAQPGPAPSGMVWIPGGRYRMGSEGPHAGPAEKPVHAVDVDGFFMDIHTVTNAEFRAFVKATNYVTVAERAPTAEEILRSLPPGTPAPPPEILVAGSVVFAPANAPVNLRDPSQWWRFVAGANWKHPAGPHSSIADKDTFPVVQVAYPDAVAYSQWAGKRLPTEAEWEFAARGGREQQEHVWGDAPFDSAHPQANIYEGVFPSHAAEAKPVGTYLPNAYGLHDMSGNVWQWTLDVYSADTYQKDHAKGVVKNPGLHVAASDTGAIAAMSPALRVLRGGSYLCSDTYCRGYRISSRSPGEPLSGATHIGFRTVMSVAQWKQRSTEQGETGK